MDGLHFVASRSLSARVIFHGFRILALSINSRRSSIVEESLLDPLDPAKKSKTHMGCDKRSAYDRGVCLSCDPSPASVCELCSSSSFPIPLAIVWVFEGAGSEVAVITAPIPANVARARYRSVGVLIL